MTIYAQHGYGEGEKIINALTAELINGVIFSPRDITPDKLFTKIAELKSQFNTCEILFDPQYYACLLETNPNLNIGKLVEYRSLYFDFFPRRSLEKEKTVLDILARTIAFQDELGVNSIIAPNIVISNSFDSIEAVIAKNFIRLARSCYSSKGKAKPIYCTLAVSREALNNTLYLQEFLNEITLLEDPPDGFYLIVGARNSDARNELLNADVLASWMLINYSLKVNGFKVINGYSDLYSPLLSSVGADVGATGWWSNLRTFSLDKFTPSSSGGRLPVPRYLSNVLINRITYYELEAIKPYVPQVLNGLKTDALYNSSEPERANEVLQTWEALSSLCAGLSEREVNNNLRSLEEKIRVATDVYFRINQILRLEQKSNGDHLESFRFAIRRFRELAEI